MEAHQTNSAKTAIQKRKVAIGGEVFPARFEGLPAFSELNRWPHSQAIAVTGFHPLQLGQAFAGLTGRACVVRLRLWVGGFSGFETNAASASPNGQSSAVRKHRVAPAGSFGRVKVLAPQIF